MELGFLYVLYLLVLFIVFVSEAIFFLVLFVLLKKKRTLPGRATRAQPSRPMHARMHLPCMQPLPHVPQSLSLPFPYSLFPISSPSLSFSLHATSPSLSYFLSHDPLPKVLPLLPFYSPPLSLYKPPHRHLSPTLAAVSTAASTSRRQRLTPPPP